MTSIPWGDFLSSRPVWALCSAHAATNVFTYFSLTWLPTYFNYQFSMDTTQSSSASLLPFVAAALGGLSAGVACDALVTHTNTSLTRARKLMQTVGFVGPMSTLTILAVATEIAEIPLDKETAELLLCVGLGSQAWSAAGYGCCAQDISKQYASLLYAATSVLAVLAGASGQYLTGWLLDQTSRDFGLIFGLISAVQLAGLCAYWAWWDSEPSFD